MHTQMDFTVDPKTGAGKGNARKLRADGKTPGVVYGRDLAPVMVTFREKDLAKALSTPAARNVFLNLKSEDKRIDGSRVMVKDLQVHPVKRVFVHADFYKLDPDRVIHVTVPVRLEGTAVGVKAGGIMQVTRREVLVASLPDNLPEAIMIDVSDLKPGASLHVGDLVPPDGVTILTSPQLAICAVISASQEVEAVAEPTGAAPEQEGTAAEE